jgi:hypothetical protein
MMDETHIANAGSSSKSEDDQQVNALKERIRRAVNEMAAFCGSAVEATLLEGIAYALGREGFGLGSEPSSDKQIGHVYVQAPIGKPYPYKADILIKCQFWDRFAPLNIVVECDGPWHDKYNQYHDDRKRDRWMQAHGYVVLRFPTAEIERRGAWHCAEEVVGVIVAYLEREKQEFATGERARRMANAIRGR